MTWADMARMRGWYVSDALPIMLQSDGALSSIQWEALTPQGTSVAIETTLSLDGGHDWTSWSACVNGGGIPGLAPETYLGNAHVRFRVLLQSGEPGVTPVLQRVRLEFAPVFVLRNEGDAACRPELWITKLGEGDFAIRNLSQGNQPFRFTALADRETVYVNNERQYIETDLAVTERYGSFNDAYLELPRGVNLLRLEGDADVRIRYEWKWLQ